MSNRSTLLLYYRLWWNAETKLPSFFDQRTLCLPFCEAQWRRLAELAEAYLRLDGERANNTALFHLGWAKLQFGESQRSAEVFDYLATVSLSYRRGRSLALISYPDGRPREFVGEPRNRQAGNRGVAWVDDLRLEVRFAPQEFPIPETRQGRQVIYFHIALNYRGFFAQPTHRYNPFAVLPR